MDPTIAMIAIIVSGLTGGLAGAVITNWFTIRRDKANRRIAFGGFIQSLIYELEAMNDKVAIEGKDPHFLHDWYKAALPSVRCECAKISQDICVQKRGEMSGLLQEFYTQGRRGEKPYEENSYQPQIDRLKKGLQTIMKLAG